MITGASATLTNREGWKRAIKLYHGFHDGFTVNMLKYGGSFTMQNGGLTTKNHRFNSDMFRVQWDIYNILQPTDSVWFV